MLPLNERVCLMDSPSTLGTIVGYAHDLERNDDPQFGYLVSLDDPGWLAEGSVNDHYPQSGHMSSTFTSYVRVLYCNAGNVKPATEGWKDPYTQDTEGAWA